MRWLQLENTLREMWYCLPDADQRGLLEAYDPDWITHFCNDDDKAYKAYREDDEFQDLLREYHESF